MESAQSLNLKNHHTFCPYLNKVYPSSKLIWIIYTLPQISLATLAGQIKDSEIAVTSEMRDTLKVHGAQT